MNNNDGLVNESAPLSGDNDVAKAQKEIIANIQGMSASSLVDYLGKTARSNAYVVIRDYVTQGQLKEIQADPKLKKEFGAIKQEAKQSWDYDHKTATISDVNKACTSLYSVILKLMKASNEDVDSAVTGILAGLDGLLFAINRIETHLGLELTAMDDDEEVPVDSEPVSCDQNDCDCDCCDANTDSENHECGCDGGCKCTAETDGATVC